MIVVANNSTVVFNNLTSRRANVIAKRTGNLWDKVLGSYRTIDENRALTVMQAISMSYKKENEGKSKNFPSTLLLYAVRDSNPGPID